MASGTYRHRVTVQTPGPSVPDGDGGFTKTWVDSAPPDWAVSIAPVAAVDTAMAGTVIGTATHQVRGRYHAGVTTEARLLFESRVFHVAQVRDVDERHRTLEVICAEVVA
jgi:SPP1 family predicted phage head-tail adaptor